MITDVFFTNICYTLKQTYFTILSIGNTVGFDRPTQILNR